MHAVVSSDVLVSAASRKAESTPVSTVLEDKYTELVEKAGRLSAQEDGGDESDDVHDVDVWREVIDSLLKNEGNEMTDKKG
eukprot:179623-Rhodomonas_salina.1